LIANSIPTTALQRLVDSVVFRRIADAVLRARTRRDILRFDQSPPAACQRRVLLGLVNAAQNTPFGREHDFHRIRREADFRRLVPLRAPGEAGHGSSAAAGANHAHRAAWRTAFALAACARSRGRLFDGRPVFLAASGASDLAGLPWPIRPCAVVAGEGDAEQLARTPVSCLAGPADQIVSLVDRETKLNGCSCISEIWPGLTAVFYSRRSPLDDPAPRLRTILGDSVLVLETCFLREGPAAVEDPRRGCLSLLFDHGVYFEFTPAAERGKRDARRHSLAEVEPGVVYEMAMTSPAGAWACRTGVAVRFERRGSPLLRLVEMPPAAPADAAADGRSVVTRPSCPPQAPHRQIAGIPAVRPERIVHIPWSAPADRG
jgi:hypothetical protein